MLVALPLGRIPGFILGLSFPSRQSQTGGISPAFLRAGASQAYLGSPSVSSLSLSVPISISLDLHPWVDIHGFISQLQGSPSVPPTVCSSQQEKVIFQWNHCPFFPVLTLRAGSGSFLFSPRAVKPGKKGKPGKKTPLFPGMLSSSSTSDIPRILIRNVILITTSFSTDKPSLQGLPALQIHEFPLLLNLAFLGPFHGDKFHGALQPRSPV